MESGWVQLGHQWDLIKSKEKKCEKLPELQFQNIQGSKNTVMS